jgi:hypothetical protein
VSLDVRSQVSTKLLDTPAHSFGVALNLRDVEYETWCFQSFKFHFLSGGLPWQRIAEY